MRTILLLLCLWNISICTRAQIEKHTRILEPSILVCQYDCVKKVDTLGTDTSEDRMILRIGKNASQFYAYSRFHNDSMCCDPKGKRMWGQMMVQAIRSRNYSSMPISRVISEYFYKNYPEGKITTLSSLGTTPCQIEEEYVPQDWKLADSTRTILGYSCQLAECHFRGRDYQAWFTPEIPLNEGPWKFNGLPGLIMEVYDTKHHYHFTLAGLQQSGTEPVCYYDFQSHYEKIGRIEYLKACRSNKGTNPEIRKRLNLDNPTPAKRNAQGQIIANDYLEKDYR